MGFDKLLVPLDGSILAEVALRYVAQVANRGAQIRLLSVVDCNCLSEIATRKAANLDIVELEQAAISATKLSDSEALEVVERQRYLKLLAVQLSEKGFKATTQVIAGYAATSIIEVASSGFDVIVMSTHGRTGLSKVLLGSVAEDVLRNSPCPVLIVHAPSQDNTGYFVVNPAISTRKRRQNHPR